MNNETNTQSGLTYIPDQDLQELVRRHNKFTSLIDEIPDRFLDGSVRSPHDIKAFDINQIFSVHDRVRLRPGYTLDYVYNFDGHGGEPLVYARRTYEVPCASPEEYWRAFALPRKTMVLGEEPTLADSAPYLRHIEFEKDALGFFQFGLFCMTIRRFYLYWHALYNDRTFMLTLFAKAHFLAEKTGGINTEDVLKLARTDWKPRVLLDGNSGEVIVLSFEEDIGYSLLHIHLEWPNMFVRFEDEVIVPSRIKRLY